MPPKGGFNGPTRLGGAHAEHACLRFGLGGAHAEHACLRFGLGGAHAEHACLRFGLGGAFCWEGEEGIASGAE